MECYPSTSLEFQSSDDCKESCVINRETVMLITGGNNIRLIPDTHVKWWKWLPKNRDNQIYVNLCDNPIVKGFVDKKAVSDLITFSDSDDDTRTPNRSSNGVHDNDNDNNSDDDDSGAMMVNHIPPIRHTGTSSMSSVSSSSSVGSTSSVKRGIQDLLIIDNPNASIASSGIRYTRDNVRRVMKKKKATANETTNETANKMTNETTNETGNETANGTANGTATNETTNETANETANKTANKTANETANETSLETANNKPARVIWFLFSNSGNKNFWSRNSDAKPVLISCEGYEEPKNDGDGNFQLCLTNLSKAHYSWNDVLKALNVYMNQTMRLCVNHTIAYPGQVLNGMNNFETIEKKSPLVLNKKVYGYLYKANSTDEFGILMKTNHHISEHAHANGFGKEFNYDGKVFCLYNSIADEFGFLAYQYNCEWMKIRSGSRFTGLCAYLLKEGIEKDKE